MAQLGQAKSVAVAFIGKLKTVLQMVAIPLLLGEDVIPGVSTPFLGALALWIAAILTLWSMFHYLKLAAPQCGERRAGQPDASGAMAALPRRP
jgi:CDP-diacylglycerol--glycerol-3-phosphate 3-phosphatidyltransferase/cardiolipin synthase